MNKILLSLLAPKSILVIDDNADMLMLGRMVLEGEGYRVFTASSGTQALQMLSTIAEPNLVLLDMKMGDMSGQDFLNQLEVQNPQMMKDMPVVFYTGMDEVVSSKAKGFIRKTGNIETFLASVHGFIQTALEDTSAKGLLVQGHQSF